LWPDQHSLNSRSAIPIETEKASNRPIGMVGSLADSLVLTTVGQGYSDLRI
jgi:hypothetical protein